MRKTRLPGRSSYPLAALLAAAATVFAGPAWAEAPTVNYPLVPLNAPSNAPLNTVLNPGLPPPPRSLPGDIPAIALTSHAVSAADYPRLSIRDNEQGAVVIRYEIKTDGHVGTVDIVQSSGFRDLDDAAVTMVRARWLFSPAKRKGKPISSLDTTRITFSLR